VHGTAAQGTERQNGYVLPYGGDEFVVLMGGKRALRMRRKLHRMLQALMKRAFPIGRD